MYSHPPLVRHLHLLCGSPTILTIRREDLALTFRTLVKLIGAQVHLCRCFTVKCRDVDYQTSSGARVLDISTSPLTLVTLTFFWANTEWVHWLEESIIGLRL